MLPIGARSEIRHLLKTAEKSIENLENLPRKSSRSAMIAAEKAEKRLQEFKSKIDQLTNGEPLKGLLKRRLDNLEQRVISLKRYPGLFGSPAQYTNQIRAAHGSQQNKTEDTSNSKPASAKAENAIATQGTSHAISTPSELTPIVDVAPVDNTKRVHLYHQSRIQNLVDTAMEKVEDAADRYQTILRSFEGKRELMTDFEEQLASFADQHPQAVLDRIKAKIEEIARTKLTPITGEQLATLHQAQTFIDHLNIPEIKDLE